MKRFGFIILLFVVVCESNGQEISSEKTSTFTIKHNDFFSIMKSIPNVKEREFNLSITEISKNSYKACYLNELVNCLFYFDDLRKEGIKINKDEVCLIYTLSNDNNITVNEKVEVIKYLKELKEFILLNIEKNKQKNLLSNVDYYLKNQDILEDDLVRELKLIHKFDNTNIPIGISSVVDAKEEATAEDLKDLDKNDIEFLNKINWENFNQIYGYRTPEVNESDFLYDYLMALDLITTEEQADINEIVKAFLEGKLDINKYDNITLNRDQRHLDKKNQKLSYLLIQKRTVSSTIKKITSVEIIKK